MRLEQSLVLNRFFHGLLGAQELEELKQPLNVEEGPAGDGQGYFYGALLGRVTHSELRAKLAEYDSRIMGYEQWLSNARGGFRFKYFQYLCLLYTEIFLDLLTEGPGEFLRQLNGFLNTLKKQELSLRDFPEFTAEDLRRLAFFMATGSGKTLLLHVNLWQVLHYLEHGKHPEALVQRADRHREFNNILLITPNDGLSQQHLKEFARSGVDGSLLIEDLTGQRTLAPRVKVIEIHKLAEEATKQGVSVLIEELGGANLVFVDEGHKGTSSEARTWKRRQQALCSDGFLLEYSATFAQSVGAASKKVQEDLVGEYGKCILFDYSYRHFYGDGYGKDFRVLNLARARADKAHELLLGGLLTYFQQVVLFHKNQKTCRMYNIERPLWVFLGSRVSKKKAYERDSSQIAEQERSDVATIVAFLKRFLEEREWAIKVIRSILKGESGFFEQESKEDLFVGHLAHLKGTNPEEVYRSIASEIFHGQGGLEIWELKNAEGELGLRVSAAGGKSHAFFGVINIGDVSDFKKHLQENLRIETHEERFHPSLFSEVDRPDSSVNVLVGAKKFIEGWSSWRVSTMGLLNIGKGEGPQVIQLFGRGVRLKGKKWSLKRSSQVPAEGPHPDWIVMLETLFIFGWNADYVESFRSMIENEDVGRELEIQLKLFKPWPKLLIPVTQGYKAESETWTLAAEPLNITLDLTPKLTEITGTRSTAGAVGQRRRIDFNEPSIQGLLDMDKLYTQLLEYKVSRGYGNVFVPRSAILPILKQSQLFMAAEEVRHPGLVQNGASRVLKSYLDRFVARRERQAESRHLAPGVLVARERTVPYRVRVSDEELLKEIEKLVRKPTELYNAGGKPLPRLHLDRHLFSPILRDPSKFHDLKGITISPPGLGDNEAQLVEDLAKFWSSHKDKSSYKDLEIYVMRNLPRVGAGFFRRSGFYPDFLLWVNDKVKRNSRVQFVEPHGMHQGGLSGNQDKIEALKELKEVSQQPAFQSKKITLSGYIVTKTDRKDIPGAEDLSWEELKKEHRLLRQEGNYWAAIISAPG